MSFFRGSMVLILGSLFKSRTSFERARMKNKLKSEYGWLLFIFVFSSQHQRRTKNERVWKTSSILIIADYRPQLWVWSLQLFINTHLYLGRDGFELTNICLVVVLRAWNSCDQGLLSAQKLRLICSKIVLKLCFGLNSLLLLWKLTEAVQY